MGTKERAGREKEAVRTAILQAARELFVTEGYRNVSMRKIAERIEYSPAAIYSYFPSKDDIFFALAEEGFRLLPAPATEPPPGGEPLDEIRSMFWHYFAFSKTHPEYFALMFIDRTVPRITRDWHGFEFVAAMKQQLHERIQRAVDSGAFPAGTPPHAVFRILLTALHGAATLRICNRMERGEDADVLAHATLDAALQGLRAGSAVNCQLSECVDTEVRTDRHDS